MPPEVQEQLDAYAGRFFVLKTPRKLLWRPDLGAVSLTLTVGDDTLDLTVTPLQAAILMQFRVRPFSLAACCFSCRGQLWCGLGKSAAISKSQTFNARRTRVLITKLCVLRHPQMMGFWHLHLAPAALWVLVKDDSSAVTEFKGQKLLFAGAYGGKRCLPIQYPEPCARCDLQDCPLFEFL